MIGKSAIRTCVASFLLALILPSLTAAPARAVGEPMTLLGVDSGQRAVQIFGVPGAAVAGPAAIAAAEAPGADCMTGGQRAELVQALHQGDRGKRVALIVRGSNFGIHPYVQGFVARLAASIGGDARMAAFLREHLERTYLSDERATRAYLERMGYEVKLLSSAELGGNPEGFKTQVLAELEKPATSIFMFFGHSGPTCLQLWGGREHQAPGPEEIREILQGRGQGSVDLSPGDITGALDKRGAAGKLDAVILHGCRGAIVPYMNNGTGSFADCVKDAGAGFFAGWVTYATYFTPKTSEILDAFFCHASKVVAAAPAADLAATSRYYKKSGAMTRRMSLLAGLDDELSVQDEYGKDFATFEADRTVHEHNEAQIGAIKGLDALISLAYGLMYGRDSLGTDLKNFFTAYTAYAVEAGVDLSRNGRPAPRTSSPLTRADVNALIAHHGPETLSEGLGGLLPGLLALKYGRAWLDDRDVLQIDISVDINRARDVDQLIELISGSYVGRVEGAIVGAIPPTTGRDPLGGAHAFGLGIGPELAARVRATIAQVRARIPNQVLSLRLRMSLEKVPPAQAWITPQGGTRKRAKCAVRPLVYGYNLAVGDVPQAKKDSRASPYEIHVALKTVNDIVKPLVMGMLGNEIELEYIYNPGRFLPNISLYAYVKLWDMADITGNNQTLDGSGTVQLRVNWGIFGNGYAYATFNASCTVSTPGGLTIGLNPSGSLSGVRGLPGPGWLQDIFVGMAERHVNAELRRAVPATFDLATLIPAEFRDQVVGKVKMSKVEVKDGVLSVYMDHDSR